MLTRKPLRIAIAIAILAGAAGARAMVPETALQASTRDATVLERLQSVPLHDVTSQPRTPGPVLPPTIGQCAPTASRVAGPDRFAPRAAAAHLVPFRHPSRDGASVQALPCGDRTRPPRAGAAHTTFCLVGVMMMLTLLGLWWDSSPQGVSPKALVAKLFIHATHSYLTEWAIDKLKGQWPEIEQYRKKIIEGANTEMHADDENAQGTKYGINLPDKAKKRGGNNAGCSNPKGYWDDCLDAYRAGEKEKAYFLLGILLHMIQDMGVPAHACGEYHEGRIWNRKWDNFEAMGTFNWKPSFDNIPPEQENPEPSDYYAVSKDLTLQDVCDFLEIKRVKGKEPPPRWDINAFSKTWLFANHRETALLSRRQGCTCHVTMWALKSAARALAKTAKGGDTTAGPKPAQPPATTARRVYPVPPITWHQPATAAAGKRIHLVKKGDTLWGIAKTYYGDGRKWSRIYGANKAVIGVNPNKIYPGQKLEIP